MIKELLSDVIKSAKPSYQPETFNSYVPMILTIITLTILGYGLQTTTIIMHAYAANPTSVKSNILEIKNCNGLTKTSLNYICKGIQSSEGKNYQSDILSFEQDLHISIK